MTTETRNEAAERLHDLLWTGSVPNVFDASRLLDEALAAERRATVEAIFGIVHAILDEEAAR